MTVLESIQRSADFLSRKGVDSPRHQAELLTAHVLQLSRLKLYLNFERPLTDAEVERLRELVKRRGQREPLQHILGTVSFCGLEIEVNKNVLIPRPETELLAEKGWEYLNQLAASGNQRPRALDVGTGSGCIAILVAAHCPQANISAGDISEAALQVARRNAARHQLADRIHFLHGNAFTAVSPGTQFDLIISNPPYIPSGDIDQLQPEVRDFDPRSALDGGPDGLSMIRLLARETAPFLEASGKLMMEFGDGQENAIQKLFLAEDWRSVSIIQDYSGRPRILIADRGVS